MKLLKFNSFIISLALFFIFVAVEASAATYYVAKTGNDTTGNGSEGNPWLTIQKGVNNLSAGDTLIVKDGTYSTSSGTPTKTVNIPSSANGTSGNWTTIKSENKWGAVLDGQSHSTIKGFNFRSNVDYVRIEDFEIKDYLTSAISINQSDISNIYIYGNHIHGIGQVNDPTQMMGAIDTYKGTTEANAAQYVTIDSNVIHDTGKLEATGGPFYLDHGIYGRGHHHTIINNIFYNNKSGWDIHMDDKGGYSGPDKYLYVANNTIFADNFDYTSGRFGGIIIRHSSVWIENNIVIVPTGSESLGGAINVYNAGTCEDELYFKNNLTNADNIWAEHDNKRQHACTGWPTLSNNLENVDPDTIFVGASIPSSTPSDYALKASTPAIDAGKTPVVPDLPDGLIYDYRKTTTRPKDSGYDIGAYEYVTLTESSPKAPTGMRIP